MILKGDQTKHKNYFESRDDIEIRLSSMRITKSKSIFLSCSVFLTKKNITKEKTNFYISLCSIDSGTSHKWWMGRKIFTNGIFCLNSLSVIPSQRPTEISFKSRHTRTTAASGFKGCAVFFVRIKVPCHNCNSLSGCCFCTKNITKLNEKKEIN